MEFAIDKDEKIGDEFDKLIMNNINKFYKLKHEYEESVKITKKTLLQNTSLSRKEKNKIFAKFKPKCIACGCQGGTTFRTYKNENFDRILEAYCKCSEKCDFKININLGSYKIINDSINEMSNEISAIKKNIIIHKNDLLFGIQKHDNDSFENMVKNLENVNSDYISYLDHFLQFNENSVNDEKVVLNESELIRIVNTFDDAMMSNSLLRSLHNFLNSELFETKTLTLINYYVCEYFLRNIKIEINIMKEDDNYYNLNKNQHLLKFKKKESLLACQELFERIKKYKYGNLNFKIDEKTNVITFLNNFTNNMEFNEGTNPIINDFVINVKNVNIKKNIKRKRKKQTENENENENVNVNEDEEIIPIQIDENDDDEIDNSDNYDNNSDNEIQINIDPSSDIDENNYDNYDNYDNDDDDEEYKQEPIKIGEDIKLDEVEELK